MIQGTYEIFTRIAERISITACGAASSSPRVSAAWAAHSRSQGAWPARLFCASKSTRNASLKRLANGYLDRRATDLDDALPMVEAAKREGRAASIAVLGNAADVYETLLARGIIPDVVTDQTAAHDLVYGYVPSGRTLAEVRPMRRTIRRH